MTCTAAPSLLQPEARAPLAWPAACLGLAFLDDETRPADCLDRLRDILAHPEGRRADGFPLGEDEDILGLPDPRHLTACSNPFLKDVIAHHRRPFDPKEPYRSEPVALSVPARPYERPRKTG